MADREIEVVIRGKNLSDDAFKEVQKDLSGIGEAAQKTSSAMDVAFGVLASTQLQMFSESAGRLFSSMVSEAIEAEQNVAQLEAVLRSTGGAAGITSDMALELADSLANLTTYEDDAVLAAENMLLTFTSISKEVFPDATKIILDMSTALGQDLKSSAIQVGKALQDPILGVTVLRRVGVNFSNAQVDIIKNMVESNDLMGAQKFILEELQREFEGSAEAAADTFGGALTQLKNKWLDFQETIGTGLTDNEEFKKAIQSIGDALDSLAQTFEDLPDWAQVAIIGLVGLVAALGRLAMPLISLKILFDGLGASAGVGLAGRLSFLSAVIHGRLLIAFGAISGALAAITAPVWLLIGAIGVLVTAIVLLGPAASKTFMMIADIIAASLKRAGYELRKFWINLVSTVRQMTANVRSWFAQVGRGIVEGIKTGISSGWEGLKTWISNSMDSLLTWVKTKLGIKSPSKLFADEIGLPLAQGIGLGIERGMSSVRTALGTLAMPQLSLAPASSGFVPDSVYRQNRITSGGSNTRISVGRIEVHNPLTQGERYWVRKQSENITERTLSKVLK